MSDPICLNDADKTSHVWGKLMRHWNDRLATLHAQNDGDLDMEATAKLRGRIAEIRSLMALDKDTPIFE